MSSSINTFIKVDGAFVNICDIVSSRSIDPDYVEGAIVWQVGHKSILTIDHCDLVDQLWAYCIKGIGIALEHGHFRCYFPDQALLFEFAVKNNNMIEVTVGHNVFRVLANDFYKPVLEGGREFFQEIKRLLPDRVDSWDMQLSEIDRLEQLSRPVQ